MNEAYLNTNKLNRFISIISIILLFLVSFITFYFGYRDNQVFYIFKFLLYLFLSFIISIIAHETGHLIFGLLCGYKFISYQILFLKLEKTNNRFKFKFVNPIILGQCLLSYDKDERLMNYKMYLYGGSTINLLLFVGSLSSFLLELFVYDKFYLFYLTFAYINIYLFFSNGIPLNIKNVYNDALNIKLMNRYPFMRKAIFNQLKMQEQMNIIQNINDFDDDIFKNSNKPIPYKVSIGYPFILLRTMKRVLNNESDPFSEIKEVDNYINYYPYIYRNTNYALLLFSNLITNKEYKWIINLKENQKLFNKSNKNDPILSVDQDLIKYNEQTLTKEQILINIENYRKSMNENLFYKVEIDFNNKLLDITVEYLENKENIL